MYILTVLWFAADGWFDPTILWPFSKDNFARWHCAMGYFLDFPMQKFLEPLSKEATPLSGLQRKRKSLQQLLETPV